MEGGQLRPSQGYRWVGLDPRITPGPADLGKKPDPDPEIRKKPENLFPARFALLRPNQGTYRHGRGIHGSGLT